MRYDWSDPSSRAAALARPPERSDDALQTAVRAIVDDIREKGWEALVQQALRIDGAEPRSVKVAPHAAAARRSVSAEAQAAIALAARHIEAFHRETMPRDTEVSPYPGLDIARIWRPLERVGLYVPGGTAPLFSTLLMLAIPARVAGVGELVVVTPPRRDGGLDPAIALAAEAAHIDTVWTVGGAQAIAALAFGAGHIPTVDRICGPGNAWVAAAKAIVAALPGGPGIDLPAGPSELMVIGDDSAEPAIVAADLLSQAEHGADAQVILVSPSPALIEAVEQERAKLAQSIGGSFAPARYIVCADLGEAVVIANLYRAEHLALACEGAAELVPQIRSAGAVFVGHHAAESFGDYLAGPSHVLPTDGAARFTGGVSTLTFMKQISVQRISRSAAAELAAPAALLARLEGLEAHARAAEARSAA